MAMLNNQGIQELEGTHSGRPIYSPGKWANRFRILSRTQWCTYVTRTHTHTHVYIYICVCVCVCVCIWLRICCQNRDHKTDWAFTFGVTVTHFVQMKPANAMFMLRQYPDNLCMLCVLFPPSTTKMFMNIQILQIHKCPLVTSHAYMLTKLCRLYPFMTDPYMPTHY